MTTKNEKINEAIVKNPDIIIDYAMIEYVETIKKCARDTDKEWSIAEDGSIIW